MSRRARLLLFVAIPVLVFFGTAELTARVLIRNKPLRKRMLGEYQLPVTDALYGFEIAIEPDPDCGYRQAPSPDPDSRRPPRLPAPPKAPGEVRVLAVGDSTTFGLKLPEDEAWPALLQGYLNEWAPAGTRFEVYNGGVPGYGPQQTKRLLQRRLIALEPDIVLWRERPRFADAVELGPPRSAAWTGFVRTLYRSRFVYLAQVLYRVYVLDDAGYIPLADLPSESRADYRPNVLPPFVDWLEDRGVAALVGVDYLSHSDQPPYELRGTADQWAGLDIPFVEGYEAFSRRDKGRMFIDPIHLTPEGADLQARLVSEFLKTRWPIGPGRSPARPSPGGPSPRP